MTLSYDGERIDGRSISELKKLVKLGEGLRLEFKFKAKYPDKIVREIVAFANTSGGLLLLGVCDNGRIDGVQFADEEEYVLVREIERSITPKIDYSIERINLPNDREVLIFHIPESNNKPHKVIENSTPRVYVREEDRTIQASREIREILKGQQKGKSLRFAYGDKERILMQYLVDHQNITVRKFSEIAKIPMKQASRTITLMVLTSVLSFQAKEEADVFMMA